MDSSKLDQVDTLPLAKTGQTATKSRQIGRLLMAALVLLILAGALFPGGSATVGDQAQTFTTIFLGIFIEAVPFLLAGSLVSGFIELFINQEALARLLPRRALPSAFVGSLLGFIFPVCECGVVPVTRRLYQKGLPMPIGVAFLLSAPVVNPIVLASTYVAFGWGPMLIGRFVFTILIAFITGLIFHFARPQEILLPAEKRPFSLEFQPKTPDTLTAPPAAPTVVSPVTTQKRIWQSLVVSADDFMDMVRYLIVGSMLAAAMQTFVPQSTLLAFGGGPVTSVIAMMALAFVLSICSTVDAFLALSFVSTFTSGSILSFLVFGPMVDIKSALMFLGVFRRRTVLYLILIPLTLTLLVSVFINLNLSW